MRRLFLTVTMLVLALAAAQSRAAQEAAALVWAKQEAEEATRRSLGLEQQAARATGEAARTRAQVDAVAARIQAAEAGITAAEARIRLVGARRAEQRARLAERQAPIVRLTAALQMVARRPPALALIQPGSMDDVVHVRSLLATTLPVIRARTASIRQEIGRSEALQQQARAAAAALGQGQQELRRQRTALATLEERQRRRSETLTDTALAESDRAIAFGEEARDIGARLGDRQVQARVRRLLESVPPPEARPALSSASGIGEEPPRLPGYRLPVEGQLVTGTGELSDAGIHARGLVFDAVPGTAIVAPAAGRVAYAGRYRGYGEIVIIDHGDGWTSLVTNLGERAVETGTRLIIGAPLGRTLPGASRVSVELRLNGRPVPVTTQLY